MSRIACTFKYACPQEWRSLDVTPNPEVRFCSNCSSNVYLATTAVEFERYAREDKCVALLDHGVMMLGMPEGWRDPYLVVPPQAYSQKQLYLLRRVLPFYASVEEAREMFYMKEVKLEDISMQDAVALQAALMELGIDSRVVKD